MTEHDRTAADREVERRTRVLYSDWMVGGMTVLDALVESAGAAKDRSTWPIADRPPSARAARSVEFASVLDPERIHEAVGKGWLVSVPEAEPVCRNRRGRLAGLSVVVKDVIDVAGLPTRNGTPGALWRSPERSARAWELLEGDGALCLGKSATHEMAWGVTTSQIPHPANPALAPGGSSGGSAACIAAGLSAAALGTDTGGSIRIPSALCGVVGIRPTIDAISMEGVTPLAVEQDIVGPLARDVPTCAAVLEVLLGRSLPDLDQGPAGLRIGVLERVGRLDRVVERGYLDSLDRLREAGAQIVSCDSSLHRSARSVSLLTMLASSAREYAATVRAEPSGFGGEARALLSLGDALADRFGDLEVARGVLAERSAELFEMHRLDAFVMPTCPCLAPPRWAESVGVGPSEQPVPAALVAFTAWASATGFPAVSVPVHSPTLPVGMQVMAAPHREDLCLRVAGALEQG